MVRKFFGAYSDYLEVSSGVSVVSLLNILEIEEKKNASHMSSTERREKEEGLITKPTSRV